MPICLQYAMKSSASSSVSNVGPSVHPVTLSNRAVTLACVVNLSTDYVNMLGPEPVSGWDAPRWVNSGTKESPTLTPSLGCGRMLSPKYKGGHHFWLRDSILVPA